MHHQQDGAAKSHMRLQLGALKRKAKDLETQIVEKDTEIAKRKAGQKNQDDIKSELKRAYDVLKHLKKKVGAHAFDEEYGVVINDIREALGMKKKYIKSKAEQIAEKAEALSAQQKAQDEFER